MKRKLKQQIYNNVNFQRGKGGGRKIIATRQEQARGGATEGGMDARASNGAMRNDYSRCRTEKTRNGLTGKVGKEIWCILVHHNSQPKSPMT